MNLCWKPFGKLLSQPENPAQALGKQMDRSCDVGSFPLAQGWWMERKRLERIASPVAPGGISWGIMGGVFHAGQTKGPSNREINFWRWPNAGAQKCERAKLASSAAPEIPSGSPHFSCATCHFWAVPIKVPTKLLRAGSDTGQIHSLDGIWRATGHLVMNYICNHNNHIAAKDIQIEIMNSLGQENKNRLSSLFSKTCPFSCLKLDQINYFCSIPGRCSHTSRSLMLKEYNYFHC